MHQCRWLSHHKHQKGLHLQYKDRRGQWQSFEQGLQEESKKLALCAPPPPRAMYLAHGQCYLLLGLDKLANDNDKSHAQANMVSGYQRDVRIQPTYLLPGARAAQRLAQATVVEDIRVVRARRLRLQAASGARIRTGVRATRKSASSRISISLRRVRSVS